MPASPDFIDITIFSRLAFCLSVISSPILLSVKVGSVPVDLFSCSSLANFKNTFSLCIDLTCLATSPFLPCIPFSCLPTSFLAISFACGGVTQSPSSSKFLFGSLSKAFNSLSLGPLTAANVSAVASRCALAELP